MSCKCCHNIIKYLFSVTCGSIHNNDKYLEVNGKVLFICLLTTIVGQHASVADDDLGQNHPIVDKGESILRENYDVIFNKYPIRFLY